MTVSHDNGPSPMVQVVAANYRIWFFEYRLWIFDRLGCLRCLRNTPITS